MPHKDSAKAKLYWAAYRAKNREKAKAATRLWREKNPGRNAATVSAWRKKNPETARRQRQAYRAANRDRVRAARKAWLEKTDYYNSPQRRAQSRKDWLRKYGITPQQYDAMLAAQAGVCALCGADSPRRVGAKNLYVDHCHSTCAVRGLLCFPCNTLLGNAGESPDLLRRAASYIERFR